VDGEGEAGDADLPALSPDDVLMMSFLQAVKSRVTNDKLPMLANVL
jgi:glucokinase